MKITILHWDDEPHTVGPIPNSLYHLYWRHRRSWITGQPARDGGYVSQFALRVDSQVSATVRYEIHDDHKTMKSAMKTTHEERSEEDITIAIFDVTSSPGMTVENTGLSLLEAALSERVLSCERVLLLTGYPMHAHEPMKRMSLKEGQLHNKPVDTSEFSIVISRLFPSPFTIPDLVW